MSTNRVVGLLSPGNRQAFEAMAATALRPRPVRQRLSLGSRVRVRTGVFAGAEGTVASYCRNDRLIIDLNLDIRGVTLELEDRMLELLDRQ